MGKEKLADHEEKITDRFSKKLQLAFLVVTIIAAGSKAFFDISATQEALDEEKKARQAQFEIAMKKLDEERTERKEQIKELKKKLEEDNKKIGAIEKDVAVVKVEVGTIKTQQTQVIDKTEKIYDLLMKEKRP